MSAPSGKHSIFFAFKIKKFSQFLFFLALSISKVIYPETKITKADWKMIENSKQK